MDPVDIRSASKKPQRWNKYAYALSNPTKLVDPDGREAASAIASVSTFVSSSGGGLGSLVIGGTAAPLAVAAGVGIALGVAVNQVPGVSDTLTLEPVSDLMAGGLVILMGNSAKGGRGRIQSGKNALDQLLGIEAAQEAARAGKSGQRIDSIEKSKQRLKDFLDKIKTLEDAEREFPRPEDDEEREERDEEIRPPG